ncbi:hypothetical protein FSP39_018738 [Pinctada imbricata]|uniref:ceramide glucosyltransferase n=1 Tax=Pinctada imbricata TaxID=66713 RepID=A0AA88YFP2_PINIB|nr:hypothetical protein FSP39_018738 [Pinctada imbricata]
MYYIDAQTQDYILFFLGVLAFVIYGMSMFFIMVSHFGVFCHFYKKTNSLVLDDSLPGVSIIKPLMGIDPLLQENLESHFTLNYPKFELLLCVPDDQDPAIKLVLHLKEKYPDVDCKLFTGGKKGIINPMVYNMAPGYENAKYKYVWISTSRIKASTDIILDLVNKLQPPNVALVHQMPFTTDAKGFAATVEKIYFGCCLARYYVAFNMLGQCCATGMSYMFKKAMLDEVNGLIYYGKYLAEDYFLTSALHEKGHKLVVSAIPAQQNVAASSVKAYKDRMVRWLRLRLNMMPIVSGILEPLGDVFPLGIWIGWSFYHFFGISPYYVFTFHVVSMILLDYIQLRMVQNGPVLFSFAEFLAAWFFRELLTIIVYIEAILQPRTIEWGGRTYLVKYGGLTTIVDRSKKALS